MDDKAVLEEAVRLLLQAAPRGSRVILFGSRATGKALPDSDWDFIVIEPEVSDRLAEMTRLSAILGEALIPADVVVMSRQAFERWQNAPNTLASTAVKEGMVCEPIA